MNQKVIFSGMDAKHPTGDDADKFSNATHDLPEWAQLTPGESAGMLEVTSGKPVQYSTTAEAISALELRRAELNTELDALEALIAEEQTDLKRKLLMDGFKFLSREVQQITEQLRLYREQAKQKN